MDYNEIYEQLWGDTKGVEGYSGLLTNVNGIYKLREDKKIKKPILIKRVKHIRRNTHTHFWYSKMKISDRKMFFIARPIKNVNAPYYKTKEILDRIKSHLRNV